MRKQTLIIFTIVGLLMVWQALAYAATHDKSRNKKKTIEVVNLNILHGFACDPPVPGDGDQCRVRDRIALLMQHIAAAGCPDLITLQENVTSKFVQRTATEVVGPLTDTVKLIAHRLPMLARACGFMYRMVFDPDARRPPESGRGIDEELMLSRYPVLSREVMPLYSPLNPSGPFPFPFPFFRHVLYARVDHPIGPVDVFTTHLASDSDFASSKCGDNVLPQPFVSPDCPAECQAVVDIITVRECQAKQVAAFVKARHKGPEPAILSGDFNAVPDAEPDPLESTYREFTGRGWLDSHLAAGNPECDPDSGTNCTSGRDAVKGDLEKPARNVDERIDYIFVVPSAPELECKIQEKGTGLFADEPNPFLPKHKQCGPLPDPICWASDHNGTRVSLSCERSADRDLSLVSW